jgi:ferredoxin
MSARKVPIGSLVRIDKPDLQLLVDKLKVLGYRVIGPRVSEAAIVYDELESTEDLPIGYIDEQDGGRYRLKKTGQDAWFDYVVGPHSLKNYIFPPRDIILEGSRVDGDWHLSAPEPSATRLAVIGPRSCDLHALRIQDRIFLGGPFVDPGYQARRENLFIAAVNCRRAAATCFCHSLKTGPAATFGFDVALTELDKHFVIEIGTERGGEVTAATSWTPCTITEVEEARDLPARLKKKMELRPRRGPTTDVAQTLSPGQPGPPRERYLDTTDLRDLLMDNLEHPRWQDVAERCLSCGNCTLVCPSCFCSSVEEVADLTGEVVRRERQWASCFTDEHSYMSSGTIRKTTRSRYRQWLTHKLATWHDQFGSSGCVGCGRCITWCPVGIDLTEEVAAIRGGEA